MVKMMYMFRNDKDSIYLTFLKANEWQSNPKYDYTHLVIENC